MSNIDENLKAHKELHKKIYDCNCCCPCLKGEKYCDECKRVIIDFMDKYGAGILTNDEYIEWLKEQIKLGKEQNESLYNDLNKKIKKINELKDKLNIVKE